jgi:hypothetical protein
MCNVNAILSTVISNAKGTAAILMADGTMQAQSIGTPAMN